MKIPLVDFHCYFNGHENDKLNVSKELVAVIKEYGFAYLTNYGIPWQEVQKSFQFSKEFFDKPLEYKMSVSKSHDTFCGYDAMEKEKLYGDRPGDLKESFMINRDLTPWPSDWDQFKEFTNSFHDRCSTLAKHILQSFALGLGLDVHAFDSKCANGECTILRLLHYPPLPDAVKENQIRAGEHTDYGLVTLLFQDPVGGLEVKGKSGNWIPAVYYPETVLINVGDVTEMLTNGELISTPHRVVNPSDDRKTIPRYSTVFFCDPDLSCQIQPINKFVSETNPAKYPTKTYKEHLFGKFNETYNIKLS